MNEREVNEESFTNNLCSFSFLHWNVGGLSSKLSNKQFLSYILSFDFVCLVETFIEQLDSRLFPNYSVFCKPAVKLTRQGRRSGGVVCLIKNDYVSFVSELKCDQDNVLCFLIDKSLFGFDTIFLYIYTSNQFSLLYYFWN